MAQGLPVLGLRYKSPHLVDTMKVSGSNIRQVASWCQLTGIKNKVICFHHMQLADQLDKYHYAKTIAGHLILVLELAKSDAVIPKPQIETMRSSPAAWPGHKKQDCQSKDA